MIFQSTLRTIEIADAVRRADCVTSISSTLPRAFSRPSRRNVNGRLQAAPSGLPLSAHARGFAHITQVEQPKRPRASRARRIPADNAPCPAKRCASGSSSVVQLASVAHARRARQHRPALDELELPLAQQRDAGRDRPRRSARAAPRPGRSRARSAQRSRIGRCASCR